MTYVIGLARATFSGLSRIGPPTSCDSGESGVSWTMACADTRCASICRKSVGPKKSTTACTRLDMLEVRPDVERLHVAGRPQHGDEVPAGRGARRTPMRSGSNPYSAAFARSQRTAALQSSIWAGKTACWLRR